MKSRLRAAFTAAAAAGTLVAAGAMLAPSAAFATTAAPAEAGTACVVTDGSFDWGVKESFRSYISGTIANGSWEPSGGASYETPAFSWSGAQGSFDPATGEGSVSFTGTVHFTGHGGVLDLTMANPTIEFEGDGSAALLLDTKSTDAQGQLAIDATQEWVGDVTVPADIAVVDNQLEVIAMPAVLTNSGAKAFAGFYEAGAELDPISLKLNFADCATTAPVAKQPAAEAEAEVVQENASSVPWLPIIVGGIAVVVIAVTVGMLIGGRKKPASSSNQHEGDSADES